MKTTTTTSTTATLVRLFLYYLVFFIVLPIGIHYIFASLLPDVRLLYSIIGALQLLFTIILIKHNHCKLSYIKYANSILRYTFTTVITLAGLLAFSIAASILFPTASGTESISRISVLVIIQTCILVLSEEFFFRFFLQTSLITITTPITAIIVTSIMFAAGHTYQGLQGIVSAFFGGMVLSFVSYKEKSILPGITAHLSYNLLLLLVFNS